VLMPIRLPLLSTRAPQNCRGDCGIGLDEVFEGVDAEVGRPNAETMPDVTVWPTPKGLPMAKHDVADAQRLAEPKVMSGRLLPALNTQTATSESGSCRPQGAEFAARRSSHLDFVAPSMTWLLVRM